MYGVAIETDVKVEPVWRREALEVRLKKTSALARSLVKKNLISFYMNMREYCDVFLDPWAKDLRLMRMMLKYMMTWYHDAAGDDVDDVDDVEGVDVEDLLQM